MLLMVSTEREIPASNVSDSASRMRGFAGQCSKLKVCSGCRRSWLAAERKFDLARSACFAALNASWAVYKVPLPHAVGRIERHYWTEELKSLPAYQFKV